MEGLYIYDGVVRCDLENGINGSYLRLYGRRFVDAYLIGAVTEVEIVDMDTKFLRRVNLEDAEIVDMDNYYIEFYLDGLIGLPHQGRSRTKCWATVRAF